MKTRNRLIAGLLLVTLSLCSCGKPEQTAQIGSEAWEKMPEVTFGALESEKLSVQPWNSGRTEETSDCSVVESKNGYYFLHDDMLYYADKARLDSWVPVCVKPDCVHQMYDDQCSAVFFSNDITGKDGRIYFTDSLSHYPHLYGGKGDAIAIMSMLPNGEDRRIDFYVEEGLLFNGGSHGSRLNTGYWLYLSDAMGANGQSTLRLFRTDGDGTQLLYEKVKAENEPASVLLSASHTLGLNGKELYYCGFFQEPGYYCFAEKEPEKVTLPDVPLAGGYLAGNTLRYFRQNDGYYDFDIETGEEVLLTASRLENSYAAILLPNLIVESTLLYTLSMNGRVLGMEHSMELFDGTQWHSVELPEELHFASMGTVLFMSCVTSDSIWFKWAESVTEYHNGQSQQYMDMHLYRIDLSAKEMVLEYFATIEQPRPKTEG